MTYFFILAAFNIVSLSLTLAIFITACLGVGLFGFILLGTNSLCLLDLEICLLPLRKVFSHYFFTYTLYHFLCLFFWNSYNVNVSTLNVVPEATYSLQFLELAFDFAGTISTILSSRSLSCFLLTDLMLIPSNLFFFLVIVFFISDWFFVTFSNSLKCSPSLEKVAPV